jgi:1-phosphatidylinositol-3-phosphate 5-kinase
MPFLLFYRSLNKQWNRSNRFDALNEYTPEYVSSFLREVERQIGPKFIFPIGINDIVVGVYDDEPTSIISYALASQEYHLQMSDELERDTIDTSLPLCDSRSTSLTELDDCTSELLRSVVLTEDNILSMSGSKNPLASDPLVPRKVSHIKVNFGDEGPLGQVKYTVICYYAKQFDALRRMCCPSERDFIKSLSRCKKWGAQGGKSNVFFAKSMDDRFIIKQVTKTELESFMKFAPDYFQYVSESICTGSPTCIAKILGIYQVTFYDLF